MDLITSVGTFGGLSESTSALNQSAKERKRDQPRKVVLGGKRHPALWDRCANAHQSDKNKSDCYSRIRCGGITA